MGAEPPEIIMVDDDTDEVCCDGGNGALGHPQVWYNFDGRDRVICMYCDRAFVRKQQTHSRKSGT